MWRYGQGLGTRHHLTEMADELPGASEQMATKPGVVGQAGDPCPLTHGTSEAFAMQTIEPIPVHRPNSMSRGGRYLAPRERTLQKLTPGRLVRMSEVTEQNNMNRGLQAGSLSHGS